MSWKGGKGGEGRGREGGDREREGGKGRERGLNGRGNEEAGIKICYRIHITIQSVYVCIINPSLLVLN